MAHHYHSDPYATLHDYPATMTWQATTTATAEAGPSKPRTSSTNTHYPSWPNSHDEAEYCEVPPVHFLAQPSLPTSSSAPHAADHAAPYANPLEALAAAMPTAAQSFAAHNAEQLDHLPDLATLAAADYDVDVRSGFLPPQVPIRRLHGQEGQWWEAALEAARSVPLMLGGGGETVDEANRKAARRWRRNIREMPILRPSSIIMTDIRYARRAHLVLSYLAHFYMHSQPPRDPVAAAAQPTRSWRSYLTGKQALEDAQDAQDAADELAGKYCSTVPSSLAVPWVALSDLLGLPPILTYATTVLWNWTLVDPALPPDPSNLAMVESFSGTRSEAHFYRISLLIEQRGVEALTLMRASLDEAFVGDTLARRRIAHHLARLAGTLDELTAIMHTMRDGCDPAEFYWAIRPWFHGADSAPDGGGGWHYEGVDAPGVRRSPTGPSAGQSSLVHAIDIFLDVDHTHTKPRPKLTGRGAGVGMGVGGQRAAGPTDATFMERMQMYMPAHHRAFLTHLRNISFESDVQEEERDEDEDDTDVMHKHPIRSLALRSKSQTAQIPPPPPDALAASYDLALVALRRFRDEHMRIATTYIVQQARKPPPSQYAALPTSMTSVRSAEKGAGKGQVPPTATAGAGGAGAGAVEGPAADDAAPKGTGGTDLVRFLKDCRSNTVQAMVQHGGL